MDTRTDADRDNTVDQDLNPAPAAHPGLTEPRTTSETPAPNAAPLTEAAGVPGYAPLGGVMQPLAGATSPPTLADRAPRDAAVSEDPPPALTPVTHAERRTPRAWGAGQDPLDDPEREETAANR